MTTSSESRRPRWFASFYWRIAISFVVFVIVVLVGESLMVSYERSNGAFAAGAPNATAATIASAASTALADNPGLDPDAFLHQHYSTVRESAYIVMDDGRVGGNGGLPLRPEIKAEAVAILAGAAPSRAPGAPTGPVVTAPIQVARMLRGLVVMPPPPQRGMLANVAELLSLPGTLILVSITAVAVLVIFAPARRRLQALESAVERIGAGNLDARAPEGGSDEIAHVAIAFNRMARELTARTDALRQSDQQRRQTLADISHELRTPLTTIRGYLDTLDMPDIALAEETRRRYLDTVRRETQRLERIVVDLLDLARFENGVAPLDPRVVAIERVFAAVSSRFERDAVEGEVTLRTQVSDAADQVIADPDRLDQAISNLVANALRHTPRGGTIDLDASADGDGYRIAVVDSGHGIAPEHVAQVFERFYKVDAARASGPSGSGLGLSIVKAIAERHGGHIDVTSRPGRTAFVITLPGQASANL